MIENVDGGSTYSAKRDAFIGPTPSFDDKKIMWQSQSNADYLNSYEAWRSSNDNGKGQKVLEPKWRVTTSGLYNFKNAKDNWKTTSGQLSDWKTDRTSIGGDAKLSAFINNPTKLNQIIDGWKKDTSNDGLDKKAQAWLADVNAGSPIKSKKDWYLSNSFSVGVDAWIKGLSPASTGVSDESLIKSAWYFSPDYMNKAKNDKYNDKTTDAQLDAWFNTVDGIEAARHFAANNPKHAISTKFFDFWKSEAGSNYDDASKKWLDRVNKEGDKTTSRVKPTKDAWIAEGHDAWDAYKLWAQGPATSDAAVITAVKDHISPISGIEKSDYQLSIDSDSGFNNWFITTITQDKRNEYLKDGYFDPSGPGPQAQIDFKKTQRTDNTWATKELSKGKLTKDFLKKLGNKMGSSYRLYNKYVTFVYEIHRVWNQVVPNSSFFVRDIIDYKNLSTSKIHRVLYELWLLEKTKSNIPPKLAKAKVMADDFKKFYTEKILTLDTSISPYIWQEHWYKIEKNDLTWGNDTHRYFWVTANNLDFGSQEIQQYKNQHYAKDSWKIGLFAKIPMYSAYRWENVAANGNFPNKRDAGLQRQAKNDWANDKHWIFMSIINHDNSYLDENDKTMPVPPAPTAFTTWKNSFTAEYKKDPIYINYVNTISITDKKELSSAWDDYMKTDDAKKAYQAWLETKSEYKNAITTKLLQNYATYKNLYKASLVSKADYEKWSPWYIKTANDYDMYVKNTLRLEEYTPITEQLYLRYAASRYKEHDVFYVGKSYVALKNWLFDLGTKTIPIPNINGIFRHPNMKLDATLAEQEETDKSATDKPEYRGGYSEKEAYQKNKTDFKDLDQVDQNAISEDIMENKQNLFLDIATRYPDYYLDKLGNQYSNYILAKGLWSKKWLSEFSDSNREAYFAYRDKFLDNKDSGRTQVTPFSNADITKVATSLDTSDKKTIYEHTKHILEAGKKNTRTNEFITWAKDSTKKYSPILIDHYFATDALSKDKYDEWVPYWLHSKADYEKIFALDDKDIDVPLEAGETKLNKKAQTQHIALIKYFTKEMAQKEIVSGATISDKADFAQGLGQKFWNIIWLNKANGKIYKNELLDKISLWKTLYSSSNVLNDNNKKNKFKEYFEYTWKAELGIFDYLDYIIQMMEKNNNIEWNSAFIPKKDIELSKEIIDYDKVKVKEPKSGMDNFKVNQKDYIWSDIFIKQEANYKTDYDAWVTAIHLINPIAPLIQHSNHEAKLWPTVKLSLWPTLLQMMQLRLDLFRQLNLKQNTMW